MESDLARSIEFVNFKKVFVNSELNTGKLNFSNKNSNSSSNNSLSLKNCIQNKPNSVFSQNKQEVNSDLGVPNVFYRVCIYESFLYFLLYDFKSLYYARQSYDDIEKLNKELNPSLEFTDVNNLINFLLESILKIENNLCISLNSNSNFDTDCDFVKKFEINFEVLVNIIKVKWSFHCEILDIKKESNYILIQDFFVKPIINLLFSFQQFINNEKKIINNSTSTLNKSEINLSDLELVLGNNTYINKQKNFDKNLLKLTQESTKKINPFSEKESQQRDENKNLKRKISDLTYTKNPKKNFKRKKEDDSMSATVSIEREKSSEKIISEDEEKIINKVHIEKKKKSKLKFV